MLWSKKVQCAGIKSILLVLFVFMMAVTFDSCEANTQVADNGSEPDLEADTVEQSDTSDRESAVTDNSKAITAFNNMIDYFGWDVNEESIDNMPEDYGGCYINDAGILVLYVVSPDKESTTLYKKACVEKIEIKKAEYTLKEMYEARRAVKEADIGSVRSFSSWHMDERNNYLSFSVSSEEYANEAKEYFSSYPCIKITSLEGQSSRHFTSIDWVSMLRVHGRYYSANTVTADPLIQRGKLIDVCDYYIPDNPNDSLNQKKDYTYSTIVPIDGRIYEWDGYAPIFRVIGEDKHGNLVGFELGNAVDQLRVAAISGLRVRDYADIGAKVKDIVLRDNQIETGRISEEDEERFIDLLLSLKYTTEDYLDYTEIMQDTMNRDSSESGTIDLELIDGTNVIISYIQGYATLCGVVKLSDELNAMIEQSTLYSGGGIPMNTMTNAFVTNTDYSNPLNDSLNNVLWDMYIDPVEGRALYMTSGLFCDRRIPIVKGPVYCLQRYGNKVYYLNKAGQMISVFNTFEGDEAELMDFLAENGNEAITPYLETEVVNDGAFSEFRIIDGVFYTLSSDGILCGDSKKLAEKVRAFEVDYDAVNYTDEKGLWRLPENGEPLLLAEGEITDFTLGVTNIYYCKKDGIYSVNVRGEALKKLYDIEAEQILCKMDGFKTMLVILEANTGKLQFAYIDGGVFTVYESGIKEFGLKDSILIAASENQMYRCDIMTYDDKNRNLIAADIR